MIEFNLNQKNLTSTVLKDGYRNKSEMKLGSIYVWGKGTTSISQVNLTYGGNEQQLSFTQDEAKEILTIDLKNVTVTLDEPIQISWS